MFNIKNLFGDENKSYLKKITPIIENINSLEERVAVLSDIELKEKTNEFKKNLKEGKTLDEILPEVFAVVREAAKRTLGQRHFDVQLVGGISLHQGNISEMRTGEGKTLVATLPAYINALEEKGVHVVTVNDYLSRRDAVWMGQIYSFLGLSVGILNHDESFIYDPEHLSSKNNEELDEVRDELGSFKVVHEFLRPVSRKEAYAADITYGTNNEFGFDYLRDNLQYNKNELVQRGYHFAIVDEVDSILIDEARTPLIISANSNDSLDLYTKFAKISSQLKEEEDFEVDEKLKAITLTQEGITHAEKLLGIENIYSEGGTRFVHHLETAVRAKALYHKDKEYVIKDGEVIIVDEFTGRLQPGRRWSEGLHQAIEAKEGVKIKEESRTFASITFQNYFRMYDKLSGMTGTAETSSEEFYKVYGLQTYVIPTNQPIRRIDRNDLIYQTEKGKFKAIARKIKELNQKGQPVLIGTASIEKNELLSGFLEVEGIKHEVLNAKNHEREGEIIAQAGRKGAVTIATNMAGRGVDIKLGGTPGSNELQEEVKSLGGLFVLGTERHEARRIDNQLRGRAGRQGDAGETQFFVSLEDTLMRVFATDMIKNMMGRFNIPEDEPIENKVITNSLEKAQEKIEGFNFDARKHVLEYDDVLNYQRSILYGTRRSILLDEDDSIEKYLNESIGFVSPEEQEKLKEKIILLKDEGLRENIRRIILQTIDMFWVDHLETMDYLRSSVNLRAYGQRDPLVEYKKDGLVHFKQMQGSIAVQIIGLISNINIEEKAFKSFTEGSVIEKEAELITNTESAPVSAKSEVGRNDPCPCGAINPETNRPYKYKHCGLINAPHHKG